MASGRVALSSASISISGASCYWYITSDGNDDAEALMELEQAVEAEQAAEIVEEPAAAEQAEESEWSWLTDLFQ